MSMSGDHCDALANTSLEVLQFGGAVAAACYVRAKLRAPAHPGACALLTTDDAEAGGATLRAVRAEVGPYWVAELAAGLVAAHKLLSLCAENARAHQRVPHPYPAVGGVASCLAYALVARLFSAVSSSPPGGGKRTRAGERAASAALCAWCGLGVLFEATCPSDRFYVAPHTDAGGRDGEAAVRLVALSVGFAAALLAVAAPPAVELREAPATPEEAASLLSFVTFGYFTPVVDKGAAPKRYQLSGGDVPPVAPDAGAAACLRAFEGAFDEAPASAFWLGPALAPWDFWTAAAFQLGAVCFQFAPSLAIHALLAFLGSRGAAGTAPGATPRSVWLGLALLGLAPVGLGVCDTQRMMRGKTVGLKVQAAACAAVFRKALTVDPFGAKFSVGECVNLMATDARTLCRLFTFGHQLWAAPLQTAVAVAGLCFLIGWAALPGVAVVLFSMRCTTELTKRVKRRQRSMEQVRDRRLSLLSEYVAGVRVVKLFAWEADCAARVGALRREELGHLAWKLFYRAWFKVFRNVGTVVGFAAFATSRAAWYLALDGRAATAGTTEGFTALVLFATLRSGLAIWPQVVQIYVQASVGWERIANFLGRDDLQAGATSKSGARGECRLAHGGDGGFAAWSAGGAAVLRGPCAFVAAPGALTCVYGPTASGKSSLLRALLGELRLRGGATAALGGRVSYVPQKPWIWNGTLRENILFGAPLDRNRYDAVVAACGLSRDLNELPAADETEIGEKGVNLSGGQQQRVALARAAYADSAVVLLDDVLSAVDSRVGARILDDLVDGPLFRGRTVVLCTHQVRATARRAARVFEIENGRVAERDADPDDERAEPRASAGVDERPDARRGEDGKLTKEEHRTAGAVALQLYWTYMRSAGGASFAVVWASLGGFVQAASFANRLSFGRWVATAQGDGGGAFGLYAATTALFVALVALRAALSALGSWRASSRIHDAMLARLLGAPLAFFERTPSGRLLNRFSSDLASVDDELMDELYLFVDAAASLVAVVVVVVALVPLVVVAWVPVLLATSRVAGRYLATSRELKRLDSTTRSPIYGGFSEALDGLSTIRAFARGALEAGKHEKLLDAHSAAELALWTSNRWLVLRLQLLSAAIYVAVAAYAVLAAERAAPAPGSTTALGLVLLYATQWVQSTNQVVRQHATVEMQMNYVERCDEYATKLPNEDPGGAAPPGAAPFPAGALAFEDVCLRYASSPTDTLRRVSFAVAPGSRCGVVGRTGAGKSTLVTALLRLAPLAGGRVLVDGVDVAALPLAVLRRGVAVVPQAATLFSGTVRSNLDPFGSAADGALREALARAGLRDALGPDRAIRAGGDDVSGGEAQLLCLARALLKGANLLVCDEATASVDRRADEAIQRVVRGLECTVLCVAHRLRTVAGFDRVVVLDRGAVAAFGPPGDLLRDEASPFFDLCHASGELDVLRRLAAGGPHAD